MKSVSLNEYLNKDNVWARRLLGIEEFKRVRDINQIEKEYNLDKYAKLLERKFDNIEAYKVAEFEDAGVRQDDALCVSLKDELFQVKLSFYRKVIYAAIKDKIEKYRSDGICELGCGYGYHLSYLGGKRVGGEYSDNAIKLAERVGIPVKKFNYYNTGDYSIIEKNSVVLTVHSLEQIPDARCFVDGLTAHKQNVKCVINFEPSRIEERSNFLGLLRNKYIEINDYNRNLFSVVRSRKDIEVLEYEQDLLGWFNPLNSTNMIVWRFRS